MNNIDGERGNFFQWIVVALGIGVIIYSFSLEERTVEKLAIPWLVFIGTYIYFDTIYLAKHDTIWERLCYAFGVFLVCVIFSGGAVINFIRVTFF